MDRIVLVLNQALNDTLVPDLLRFVHVVAFLVQGVSSECFNIVFLAAESKSVIIKGLSPAPRARFFAATPRRALTRERRIHLVSVNETGKTSLDLGLVRRS